MESSSLSTTINGAAESWPSSPIERHLLRVFSGAEISAQEGHFLVFGLPSLAEVWPGIRLSELLEVVKQHEAAIVAAHPFRWDQPFEEIVAEFGPVFDALELVSNNVSRDTRRKTASLLQRYPMGSTGSSDAHETGVVGCYYTDFNVPIRSLDEFVAALKGHHGQPRHRKGIALSSGPVD